MLQVCCWGSRLWWWESWVKLCTRHSEALPIEVDGTRKLDPLRAVQYAVAQRAAPLCLGCAGSRDHGAARPDDQLRPFPTDVAEDQPRESQPLPAVARARR